MGILIEYLYVRIYVCIMYIRVGWYWIQGRGQVGKVRETHIIAAGPAYYVLHPQKGITIFFFLTNQAFKNREGIVYQTNLAEWFKIWHLWF